MNTDDLAHDLRQDQMSVKLLDNNIENEYLERKRRAYGRTEKDRRYGPDNRADDGNPLRNCRNKGDDQRIRHIHEPHAARGKGGNDTAHEQLPANVAAEHMVEFTEVCVQMTPVLLRIDADKGIHHLRAVLHKVEGNKRDDEEFYNRAGYDKDGFHQVGHSVNTVIADFDKGFIDNRLYLIGNIKRRLIAFQLNDEFIRPSDNRAEIIGQQVQLAD